MGNFISDFFDDLTGKTGAEAALQAGNIQADAARESLAFLKERFGITDEQLSPYISAGAGGLDYLQQGSTPQGLAEQINQIMNGGYFNDLVDERTRAVQGQLSAGGLTRSGTAMQEAANIPTDIALQVRSMLTGQNQNLATMGANAITGNASTAMPLYNAMQAPAQAQAAGQLGAAQASAGGVQNILNTGLTAGLMYKAFSDPRLKTNIQKIGEMGPLNVYSWDWKEERDDPTQGFMSTEVREIFPQHVSVVDGYDMVDYPGVLQELM